MSNIAVAEESQEIGEHVEELCREVLKEKGIDNFDDISTNILPGPSPLLFLAYMDLTDRSIHIDVAENFYDAIDEMIVKEKLERSRDSILNPVMYFAVNHEFGHHKYCPRTLENMKKILEGSFEVVQGREYSRESMLQVCLNIQNMFSDTILNTINSHTDENKGRYREGLDLLYLLMSSYGKQFAKLGIKPDKAFALFLGSSQYLCNTSPEIEAKIKKYMPKFFFAYDRYKRKIIDIFTGDEELTQAVLDRNMSEQGASELVARIKDTSLWKGMSEKYTEIMYPFLRRPQQALGNSFSREEPPKKGGGSGQQGQGSGEQQENQSGSQGKNQGGGGNKQDQKDQKQGSGSGKDKKDKKDKNKSGGLADKAREFMDKLLGEKPEERSLTSSPCLDHFDELDRRYTEKAGRISIFVERDDMKNPEHEFYLNEEEMPLSDFSSKGVRWSSTRAHTKADGSKSYELFRGANPINLPIESYEGTGAILDLSFIFDSSSSMTFEPPFKKMEGFGEYHTAVLTFYSILEDLKEKALAGLVNYHVMNFSGLATLKGSTRSSGWCSFDEINKAKRTILDYRGGGTILDPDAIRELSNTRKDNFLSFMLTDGDFTYIDNQRKIVDAIEEMVGIGGVGFYLFQLGNWGNSFSTALEKRDIPVEYIQSAEDFMDKAVRFTRDLYGKVTA